MLPPFNPGKESFGTRAVTVDRMKWMIDGIFRNPRVLTAGGVDDFLQARDQVFRSRHHEDIGVVVSRKTLLCFAGDSWDRELPAESEWAISVSGTVLKRESRPEAIPAGGQCNGDGMIAGPAEQVRLERFANTFHSATTFGQANNVLRNAGFVAHLRTPLYAEESLVSVSFQLKI